MAKIAQKTKEEWRAELARDIAAIFANPVTPPIIYNGLAGAINSLFNSISTFALDQSQEHITSLLDEYERSTKGGAK